MADPGDAVQLGLVASLARPGANMTGVTSLAPALATKRMALLKEALGQSRVGLKPASQPLEPVVPI